MSAKNNGRRQPRLATPGKFWVAMCYEDSHFGGHEEGGWWYSSYTPIDAGYERTISSYLMRPRQFSNKRIARQYQRRLVEVAKLHNTGRRRPSSVLYTGGWLAPILFEETRPHVTPRRRPCYS
jgi:hypothetical protein